MSETGFVAGAVVALLKLDKSQWSSQIKGLKTDYREIQKGTDQIGKSFKSMTRLLVAGAAAVAIKKVTSSILHMAKAAAEAGHDFQEMSERTGVSVERLSGMKLAADKGGTSIEGLAIGYRFLSKNIYAAAQGSKEGKGALDALGISVKDASGQVRSMDDILMEISDRFRGLPDGPMKSALAIQLFGRSGTQLIPMLNMGSAAIKEQIALAERLGIVYTEKTAKAAHIYIDSLVDMKAAKQGLRKEISQALIPVLTKLVTSATDGIVLIRTKVKELVESGQMKQWATDVAHYFLSGVKLMLTGVQALIVGFNALRYVTNLMWANLNDGIGDFASMIQRQLMVGLIPFLANLQTTFPQIAKGATKVSLQVLEFLGNFAEAARENYTKYAEAARENGRATAPIIDAFNSVQAAIDGIVKGLSQSGKIGRKELLSIGDAAALAGVSLEENLKNVLEDMDKEGFYQELDVDLNVDNLTSTEDDVAGIIADIQQDVASGWNSMQTQITEGMKALDPAKGELANLRLELNMNKAALELWGDSMPIWKVEELKKKIAEIEAKLADATPWQRFKYYLRETISAVLPQMSSILSTLQTGQTTAIDNEYKKRLEVINSTITNEEKKQKAIVALEAEYEIKKSKARRKWAIADKALNISQAYINASQAVLKTYGQAGIFGIPLAAIIKALCAIEIAAIIAAPVEFAEGAAFEQKTHVSNAIVGEAGPEYLLPEKKLVRLVSSAMMAIGAGATGRQAPRIDMVINGPLLQTTGLTQQDCDRGIGMIFKSLRREMRTEGVSFA
jgi:hypothetical protein